MSIEEVLFWTLLLIVSFMSGFCLGYVKGALKGAKTLASLKEAETNEH